MNHRHVTTGLPALTFTPDDETVDRALAKEISRDLSLMMLAASIAKTAMASLQVTTGNLGRSRYRDHMNTVNTVTYMVTGR